MPEHTFRKRLLNQAVPHPNLSGPGAFDIHQQQQIRQRIDNAVQPASPVAQPEQPRFGAALAGNQGGSTGPTQAPPRSRPGAGFGGLTANLSSQPFNRQVRIGPSLKEREPERFRQIQLSRQTGISVPEIAEREKQQRDQRAHELAAIREHRDIGERQAKVESEKTAVERSRVDVLRDEIRERGRIQEKQLGINSKLVDLMSERLRMENRFQHAKLAHEDRLHLREISAKGTVEQQQANLLEIAGLKTESDQMLGLMELFSRTLSNPNIGFGQLDQLFGLAAGLMPKFTENIEAAKKRAREQATGKLGPTAQIPQPGSLGGSVGRSLRPLIEEALFFQTDVGAGLLNLPTSRELMNSIREKYTVPLEQRPQ